MPVVRIGKREIGPHQPCYIIAEAGSNHDGNFQQAKQLIDVAAEAGVDAVKFQVFSADGLAAQTDEDIATLRDQFGQHGRTLHDLYRKLELPREWLQKLKTYAEEKCLDFLATPFDEEAADALQALGVPAFKLASFEVVHLPLIRHVSRYGKPLILSTGMASLGDIEEAVEVAYRENNRQVILLHCGIGYPTEYSDVHLAAMDTMRQAFQIPVGYSDHTLGITVPIAAAARGVAVYEKHFTLDRKLPGPDHSFALEPHELEAMVRSMREAEAAIGRPLKQLVPSEMVHYHRGRRSLFAKVDIPEGTVITAEMISVLRPGTGMTPKLLTVVIGRAARKAIKRHQPLTWDVV